jgi:endoglycosylceramidase
LRAEGPYFRDERGAAVFLRGLNVAGDSKVPPFRPIDDPSMLDDFPDWGVNVVRLLFTWEAFEPTQGTYDEDYFSYYESTIDELAKRGARVVVDIHQDAFSRFATNGCGEGMPEWAVSPDTEKHQPDNGSSCTTWGIQFILDTDTHRCWNDFYADSYGVRTRFLELLDTLASRLGKNPAVLGIDMLNEPWGDEKTQLGPLYEDGAKAIRAKAPNWILFVSPQATTSAGPDTVLAKPTFDNFAYAPHYYDPGVVTLHTWTGSDLKGPMGVMKAKADAWKVPLFVAEFGAPAGALRGPEYIDAFYREFDAMLSSSAQWTFVGHWSEERKDGWNTEDFSIVDGQHVLRDNFRVRPYPARVTGEPTMFEARGTEGAAEVELRWKHDPAHGATRIFAPAGLFGGKVRAEHDAKLTCAYEPERRHVRCTADQAGDQSVILRVCEESSECLETLPELPVEPDAGTPSGSDAGPLPGQDGGPKGPAKASSSGCGVATGPGSQTFIFTMFGLVGVLIARRWRAVRVQSGRRAPPARV